MDFKFFSTCGSCQTLQGKEPRVSQVIWQSKCWAWNVQSSCRCSPAGSSWGCRWVSRETHPYREQSVSRKHQPLSISGCICTTASHMQAMLDFPQVVITEQPCPVVAQAKASLQFLQFVSLGVGLSKWSLKWPKCRANLYRAYVCRFAC